MPYDSANIDNGVCIVDGTMYIVNITMYILYI